MGNPEFYAKIFDRLENLQHKSDNAFTARCPSHDDNTNSLSGSYGQDGRLLLNCHAGCSIKQIQKDLDITMQDMFPPSMQKRTSTIEKTYDYVDESGTLLYQAVRKNPKGFIQRRPEGSGWQYKLGNTRRVLYKLVELLAANTQRWVLVCEGEKDCDRLMSMGMIATCNAGGAGKWRDDYSKTLRGRNVAILPDNDDAGRAHAYQVANSLRGKAANIKIVELPDIPNKGDVYDYLETHTVEQLQDIIRDTGVWDGTTPKEIANGSKELLTVTPRSNVSPEMQAWRSAAHEILKATEQHDAATASNICYGIVEKVRLKYATT